MLEVLRKLDSYHPSKETAEHRRCDGFDVAVTSSRHVTLFAQPYTTARRERGGTGIARPVYSSDFDAKPDFDSENANDGDASALSMIC